MLKVNDILQKKLSSKLREKLHIEELDSTPSTNLLAREFAKKNPGEALFIAKKQTAGRGRLGRSFDSEEGGLYMTLLLRPDSKASDPVRTTALAALAVCRALDSLTDINTQIKWVNDIVYRGKKLAGILAESEISGGGFSFIALGIGVNLKRDFPEELQAIAASVADFSKKVPTASELAAEITNNLYALMNFESKAAEEEYRSRSSVIGRDITVYLPNRSYSARVLDIDEQMRLVLSLPDGTTEHLSTGEVSIRHAHDTQNKPIL